MLENPTRHGNYRPVKGFPGYLIDDFGNVWSRRKYRNKYHSFWCKLLRQSTSKLGYKLVALTKNGCRQKVKFVHQLVLISFGFRRPSRKHITRHLNGDPSDNRLRNLKWGTHKENAEDRKRHGRDCKETWKRKSA